MTRLPRILAAMALAIVLLTPGRTQQVDRRAAEVTVTGQRDKTRSAWLRAETDNFVVYGRGEARVREMATRLERFDQLLRLMTRTPAPDVGSPLPVYLLVGSRELEQLRVHRLQRGYFSTGYYSASPTGILLAADLMPDMRRPRDPRYHDVWLFAEYTRHFLSQNVRGAYFPAWYVDGLSLNLSTVRFDGDSLEYGRTEPSLARMLKTERWEPIGKIVSGELDHGYDLYSAESALLVHYILADAERGRAFGRYLDAVAEGRDRLSAFQQAFGVTMKTLQARLFQYYYNAKGIRTSLTGRPDPRITIAQMPASADRLLLDQAAMRIGIPEDWRRRSVLRRAEDAVADRSDPLAQRVLVQARVLYGPPHSADALLDDLLARYPEDVELLYLKGLSYLTAARVDDAATTSEYRAARGWLGRVYRADPSFYPAMFGWVESLSPEPQFTSDNSLNVLLKAAELAPQATQLRIAAALMAMAKDRFDAAEGVLAPMTVSPRDPASEQIPALLVQARAHRPPERDQLLAAFRYDANWRDVNCC